MQKRIIFNAHHDNDYPISSMYGILTYIWLICMANVPKCTTSMDALGLISRFTGSMLQQILCFRMHNTSKRKKRDCFYVVSFQFHQV